MAEDFNSGSGKATNALMVVAILAVALSVFGIIATFFKVSEISQTGFASVEQGNATLEILGVASINFTNKLINWSVGSVNTSTSTVCGGSYAMLTTNGTNYCSNSIAGQTWNTVPLGLVVRNIGSTDVSLDLISDKDATIFIGGTTPGYQWLLSNYEAASCAGTLSDTTWANVATGTARVICTNFTRADTRDELRIDLRVVIPADASAGQRVSTITATATSL